MKIKDEIILKFCFKYHSCKRCPRQQKCEKELKKGR